MTPDDRAFLHAHAATWARFHRSADYAPEDYADFVLAHYAEDDDGDLGDVPSHRAIEPSFLDHLARTTPEPSDLHDDGS